MENKDLKGLILELEPAISDSELRLCLENAEALGKKGLPYIHNTRHLARVAGIKPDNSLETLLHMKWKHYRHFDIPKRNGDMRRIHAPTGDLKRLQRWILDNILYKLPIRDNVHGFVPGRSIVTNAKPHVGQDLVMKMDIEDFFPSIKWKRIRGLFRSFGYSDGAAKALADVCTFKGVLPQGSPASPAIANLVVRRMDARINGLCKKYGFTYTRYADDITISGGKDLPKYKNYLKEIILDEGFRVNASKTRVSGRGSAQYVTGLCVNDRVGIGRKERRRLRAMIHNLKTKGVAAVNTNADPRFKYKVLGYAAFAYMADGDEKILEEFRKINWD